jgi:uncharacterized membrane protein
MSTPMKLLTLQLSLFFGILSICGNAAPATDSLILYTPYTRISVPPGQSIDYTISFINNTTELKNLDIKLSGMPKGWNFFIKSGGWDIKRLAILPGEKQIISLKVGVPLKVNKGTYRFQIIAGGLYSLPLEVIVSEQGTFKTEFTTNQPNMQGRAGSSFTFTTNLKNFTADRQLYAFLANEPRGWAVTFKSNYQQVTSVNIEANSTQVITIEVKSPEKTEAGKYKIPVIASTGSTSANLELEVDITGSYSFGLTTPTGLLSTNITAGDRKRMELAVNNTGSSELSDIKLSSSSPTNWEVIFEPQKIDKLPAGQSARVFAIIKADKKAIPGDYVTNIEASTPETSSKVSFRISVETGMLWGWIGVLIIFAALGCVYYLFRKYGRR